jgi:hypothetical protein
MLSTFRADSVGVIDSQFLKVCDRGHRAGRELEATKLLSDGVQVPFESLKREARARKRLVVRLGQLYTTLDHAAQQAESPEAAVAILLEAQQNLRQHAEWVSYFLTGVQHVPHSFHFIQQAEHEVPHDTAYRDLERTRSKLQS